MPWTANHIFDLYARKRDEYLANGWTIDLLYVVESASGWQSFEKRLSPPEVAGLEVTVFAPAG